MKRRVATKAAAARLAEQADIPTSKKLKTDELAAMMGDCPGAVVSEDVDIADKNAAMAKPM